jgi:hypothetical protein
MTRRKHQTAGQSPADIAAVLARRLPDASPERLITQIAALKLLPAHAAGLVQYLQSHPEALTSGEATGPSALRALLDVLAVEHPGVQRMRCHRCGKQRALPYRRDGASICGRCYSQTHLKVCVRCGEVGQPAFRENGGIVCTRCSSRDPARRRACARCGTLARVAYRVDGKPLCQTCGPRKRYTCSSCGRENRVAHAFSSEGPLCSVCYHRAREHECVHCGRTTAEARVADRDAGTWVCNRCWVPPTMTCIQCGRVRPRAGERVGSPDVLNLPLPQPPPKGMRLMRAHGCHPDHAAAGAGVRTLLPAATAQSGDLRRPPGNPPPCRRQRVRSRTLRPLLGRRPELGLRYMRPR